MIFIVYNHSFVLDNRQGVQAAISQVNSTGSEIDSILSNSTSLSNETKSSLSTLKTLMESLTASLQSYFNLLSARRHRRSSGRDNILGHHQVETIPTYNLYLDCLNANSCYTLLNDMKDLYSNAINNTTSIQSTDNTSISSFSTSTLSVLQSHLSMINIQMAELKNKCPSIN